MGPLMIMSYRAGFLLVLLIVDSLLSARNFHTVKCVALLKVPRSSTSGWKGGRTSEVWRGSFDSWCCKSSPEPTRTLVWQDSVLYCVQWDVSCVSPPLHFSKRGGDCEAGTKPLHLICFICHNPNKHIVLGCVRQKKKRKTQHLYLFRSLSCSFSSDFKDTDRFSKGGRKSLESWKYSDSLMNSRNVRGGNAAWFDSSLSKASQE